jgi:hypothetical protein
MNISVQAGVLEIHIGAEIVTPRVLTVTSFSTPTLQPLSSCLAPFIVSINGHSLSAINPDVLIGGEATLIAA